MAEAVELPSRLGILPFRNKVLLPGAIIRIRCTSPNSVKLVKRELWQREEKGLIGIVPVRDAADSASVGPVLYPGAGGDSGDRNLTSHSSSSKHKAEGKSQEAIHWHNRGVAARALHLSRGVEKPSGRVTYTVVLEGLSRFNVLELDARGTYYTARISPLDITKSEMEQAEQDPDFVALARQFKLTAMELISVLEQCSNELANFYDKQKQKTGGRTKILLENVPIHKLADIFVASFEISFEEQLFMLDSVDLKVRLSKATELVDRHLQSIRVAEKITQKVEGQLSKSQREFLLRQQMRAIKEELGDNDDDEDDIAALERKMQSAGMPANIWKHAQRELRRLKKMQPQQPGYHGSRVYLELLADLPWQKATEVQKLDLRDAKERLDSDHYGLVKIKQRIIEYLAVRKVDHYQFLSLLMYVGGICLYDLSALQLKPDARGPVLCFVGPPGVGKTSLAASIAAALGRKFIRISLGGVRDEADIRGHRRTYIGSMPGRLIDGLKRVGVCNPVMLLDEIDKTSSDVRGDPAAALLEVLDPEQNKSFIDQYPFRGHSFQEHECTVVASFRSRHRTGSLLFCLEVLPSYTLVASPGPLDVLSYLNVPYDLSKVIFVATANKVQPIPPPLLDRMEVIELPGYTSEEKLNIAMQHLVPRVLDQHGLSSDFLQIPESMVKLVIYRYTREAGVRNLERNLAALARAAAVKVAERDNAAAISKDIHQLSSPVLESRLAEGAEVEMEVIPIAVNNQDISSVLRLASPLIVDETMLENILGPPRYDDNETEERVANPGVSVGLVWTAYGGEVQFVEAATMAGKSGLRLTGQLGAVIKESAQIALTWVRARATELNLVATGEENLMDSRDIHIHFPAGAVPKDGPSAGVTLVTALVSLLSQKRVRADTAMTGEMTLRGLVLPVGGIKDKILAAHRYGIKRVILPQRNAKDLVDVPSAVLSSLEIVFAQRVEDVLEQAFEGGCPWRQRAKL
ncbi:hypothetical protein Cgig2_026833 [Carnegiea gigantea]|uniref:Lon protease homolog 2, peroxisomal n=1 Tax=Carnegiea gigantea TaxID=171969 RepID=A0A9Q1KWM7_9CARY|nr:hypothetical protein Cgig2_026833 [Carnegiea gigantea]